MAKSSSKRTQSRFLGRMLPGAVPSEQMPGFIPVVQPVLVDEVPTGKKWIHEVKFDGYRMQVSVNRGIVKIMSRQELDWTHRFPNLVNTFQQLPVDRLVMDGEAVSLNDTGVSDFGMLQGDLSDGEHRRIVYFAFDIMFFDGFNLTDAPLIERKRVLQSFIAESGADRLLYSEHFEDGQILFRQAGLLGLEGVVSKQADSKYKPSKSAWLKVKCVQSDELNIIGYVPSGRTRISALRLGKKNGARFDYVGKVGTGFSNEVSQRLRKRLSRMEILKPSLTKSLRKPDTKWVRPELKAKIDFRGITGEGKLRHPSFKGLGGTIRGRGP